MGVFLIVTKSFDRDYKETGDSISEADWIALVDADATLSIRTEPFTATAPDGSVISMATPPGQSEFVLPDGSSIPFLRLSGGELTMRYHAEMKDSGNPVRLKVAEIARHFDALVTSDAGDDFLAW